jgi:GxxExxY protein
MEGSRICFVQRSSDSLRDMAADERQSTMSYNRTRARTFTTKGTKETQGMQRALHAAIPRETERIGKAVLDAAFTVHSDLGSGLLESVYKACCAHVLRQRGESVETQLALPVRYHDVQVDAGLRLDMLVGGMVIVEFKAVETMLPLYDAQLLTYLKLTGNRLGYLLNFNVRRLKDGIKRLVL